MRLVFDLESDGLLNTVSCIHTICLTILDPVMGPQKLRFRSDTPAKPIEAALQMLSEADEIIGHNILGYDLKVIRKLYPWWKTRAKTTDTIVISKLIWTDLFNRDFTATKKNKAFPKQLMGRHSLEAWGHRLKLHKGDYAKAMKEKGLDPWAYVNDDMVDYCALDVDVTTKLLELVESKAYSQHAIDLEHAVAVYCLEQTDFGVSVDEPGMADLYALLCQERADLDRELRKVMGCWWASRGVVTPKRSMKRNVAHEGGAWVQKTRKTGYVGWVEQTTEGAQYTKIELIEFNPTSRDHIAERMITLFGWKPAAFTENGKPVVDEEVLAHLDYPEAKLVRRYLLLSKRIGQIAEGKQAWLKMAKAGRIHGELETNGAVTGRATHKRPNLAQVPKVGSPWGKECRSFFRATPGWKLVGADASGLELRCLGHYMARWDNGAYALAVVEGKQDDGSDVHSLNAKALGLEPQKIYQLGGKQAKGRDIAKTFIYAFLYGAGDEKIGSIVGQGKSKGRSLKSAFLKGVPALGKLIEAVQEKVKKQGYLVGLDGRRLNIRSPHAALNTLLQGAGAIIMKQAMVNFHEAMAAMGFDRTKDYRQVLWVHDEFQVETAPHMDADLVGRTLVEAIRKTTTDFKFRCPLDGEYKVGLNWADTH